MTTGYGRSVLLRVAGVVTSIAIWLGLIVFALDNFDGGLPRSEGLGGGWPFWIGALVIIGAVAFSLGRSGRPGWGAFLLGLLIPEVAFLVNRLVMTEISWVFWVVVALLVLVPFPSRRRAEVAT
jgi:hypothetical protein